MKKNKRLLYIRNFAKEMDIDSYNSQEIGICIEMGKRGYLCDLVIFTNDECKNKTIIEYSDKVRILYFKSVHLYSNPIYIQVLSKSFLEKYDLVITTEYHQIMTLLISMFYKGNILLFHGPYKDENKLIKFYRWPLTNYINSRITYKMAKSPKAKEYLENKGLTNIFISGVGLDISRFSAAVKPKIKTSVEHKNKKILLYVGALSDRKNVMFLLDVMKFIDLNDYVLFVIGEGKGLYAENFISKAKKMGNINLIGNVTQKEMKSYYKMADMLLAPSKYEIFGMIFLEALYFNIPIITTDNGGSSYLCVEKNIISLELEVDLWVNTILNYKYSSMPKYEFRYSWKDVIETWPNNEL